MRRSVLRFLIQFRLCVVVKLGFWAGYDWDGALSLFWWWRLGVVLLMTGYNAETITRVLGASSERNWGVSLEAFVYG